MADSAFAYMTANGTYGADPVTDLGWPLGFALLAYAAVAARDEARAEAPRRASGSGCSLRRCRYLPVVPAVAVFVVRSSPGRAASARSSG